MAEVTINAHTLYVLTSAAITALERVGADVPEALEAERDHAEYELAEERHRKAEERRKYRELREGHVSTLTGPVAREA